MDAEITHFDKLFPVRKAMVVNAESKGISWLLANAILRKYQPCLICSVYYYLKNITYIEPNVLLRDEFGRVAGAEFDGFNIMFDEGLGWYDYLVTGDLSKYGKDFEVYLRKIVTVRNEDGICRVLLTAITGYEEGKVNLTEDGVRALYTVAALLIESVRKKVVKGKPEKPEVPIIAPPTEEIPELGAVVSMIGFIANKYKMSVDEVIKLVRRKFK